MVIVADDDREFRDRVATQLRGRAEVLHVESLDALAARLAEGRDDVEVVLVGPHAPVAEALALAEQLQLSPRAPSVVLVADALTSDLLQAALRAGIRDVLPRSFTFEQLVDAVGHAQRLARQLRPRPAAAETGAREVSSVFTVFSAKGGAGKSFLASNLAVLLAQRDDGEVALVDLDLHSGDLAIMLHAFPARTLYDAAEDVGRLDADALRAYLTPLPFGASLLAAPLDPGAGEGIPASATARLLELLRESFRYVVVDTPPAFTDHVLAALDGSDRVMLLSTLDVPSVKNIKLSLETLELLGIERDRIDLVLNRADSKVGLTVRGVQRTLGTGIDGAIPSTVDVPLSVNQGKPIAAHNTRSPVVLALKQIADQAVARAAARARARQPAR